MIEQINNEVPTGVTTEAAAPTDSNLVQPTAQTTEGAQPTVDGQGPTQNQEAVPYERFKEVNDSNKTLEQQLQLSQQQNLIYQQNSMQQVQQQPQQPSRLQQFATKLGNLDDDGTGAININEAKEMMSAMQEEFDNMQVSQQENLRTSFLAQNPDYQELVVQQTVLGQQYAPEFIEMLKSNPVAHQQLQMLENNPVQQQQEALRLARDYRKTKVTQQIQQPVAIPGQLPVGTPPSLSAIPTPMGTSSTASNYAAMGNADFSSMVDQMVLTD